MIIDAHAHACGPYLTGENIIKILDANNIDKLVLVPGEYGSAKEYSLPDLAARFPETDVVLFTNIATKLVTKLSGAAKHIDEGNRHVFSLAKNYPDRIIQFYWVMLSRRNYFERLEKDYAEYQFKGIKLHQCWESFKVGSENFHETAEWASSKNLPVFIHLFTKKQASRLSEYIKIHPKTVFIIAHLFGLERYMDAGIGSGNVYFEISSPQLISVNRIYKAIKFFGADKILMGTDVPYGKNNVELNIARVNNLEISNQEKEMILGKNMMRLLNIQG